MKRDSKGRFAKKVKPRFKPRGFTTPLPSRKRKAATKVHKNHRLTVEYLLGLAAFSGMLLSRIEQVERKIRIYPKEEK